MELLLNKEASNNPMWLSLALDELRIFGHVRQLTSKINSFPPGLIEMEENILERFEKETEADLIVGTLCLLECSNSGLLESELLKLLAKPGLIPVELESICKCSERTNHRQNERIPAVIWADVYRLLRPFLRPFGPSGEGGLNFYHRTLSEVIRSRYFSKSDKISTHFFKILSQFFKNIEEVSFERRLQEYPHACFGAGDRHGLLNFIQDWDVFDEFYNEQFSPELSRYWSLVDQLEEKKEPSELSGVFLAMQNFYVHESQRLLVLDKDIKTVSSRLEQISRVLMQNRLCDVALGIANELVKITAKNCEDATNDDIIRHADGLFLKGSILDEDLRIDDYLFRTHQNTGSVQEILTKLLETVDTLQGAISIYITHAPNNPKLGKCFHIIAFNYASISRRGGIGDITAEKSRQMAQLHIEKAIIIYEKLEDSLNQADCLITKAVCEIQNTSDELENYQKALNLIVERYGNFHILLLRVYFNIAIYYQDTNNQEQAEKWFQKWYQLHYDVLGKQHPRTQNASKFIGRRRNTSELCPQSDFNK